MSRSPAHSVLVEAFNGGVADLIARIGLPQKAAAEFRPYLKAAKHAGMWTLHFNNNPLMEAFRPLAPGIGSDKLQELAVGTAKRIQDPTSRAAVCREFAEGVASGVLSTIDFTPFTKAFIQGVKEKVDADTLAAFEAECPSLCKNAVATALAKALEQTLEAV